MVTEDAGPGSGGTIYENLDGMLVCWARERRERKPEDKSVDGRALGIWGIKVITAAD